MAVDMELSARIAAMREHGDAAHARGLVNMEAAYSACAMMLLDAAIEDGVELDLESLGDVFGVAF